MKSVQPARGFALVITLVILVAVCVLIVAFVSTMRTERAAAHNDGERRTAQSLAQSSLNRILADHIGAFQPFAVDATTKLPTPETEQLYYADAPPSGLFRIEPQPEISPANHLVRLSLASSGSAAPAYTPEDWAYLRLKGRGDVFVPKDKDGNPVSPQWINYYPMEADGTRATVPTGQIAYAIWEESGKFDINMAGKDEAINGLAPHDLGIETYATAKDPQKSASLLSLLDGGSGRQRSNFSLRKISDNTGDDRRIFSIQELLGENLSDADAAIDLTTFSRDFDVRPEWDGDRSASSAKNFLRSYVNNPDLYRLMAGTSAGPSLVRATLDQATLESTLTTNGLPVTDSWMQIMRLLAALRLSLPPHTNLAAPASTQPLPPNRWIDEDIWGIALNIVQAAAPPSDENLVARDAAIANYLQPNTRTGIRLSPYITEVAFKVEYGGAPGTVRVTEYIEIWNPYPVDLSTQTYILSDSSGSIWPASTGILTDRRSFWREITGPGPGQFKTVRLITRPGDAGTTPMVLSDQSGANGLGSTGGKYGLRLRTGPYLTDKKYYDVPKASSSGPWDYKVSGAVNFTNSANQYMLMAWIPAAMIPESAAAGPVWYSFQIDDPRMGPFTRYSSAWRTDWTAAGQGDQLTGNWKYTWQGYFNQHSLAGETDSAKQLSSFGEGYNSNFGSNWPASWPKTQEGLNRALATFGLPGRPFRNIGELGTVFANRPWRTLGFAQTVAPDDSTLTPSPSRLNWPSTLLDYLTTVGTTSEDPSLNYRAPGTTPSTAFVEDNLKKREQDNRWLFESVDGSGEPEGNLRPVRGRINLNAANEKTLTALLSAPYRVVNSLGLKNWPGLQAQEKGIGPLPDLEMQIPEADAARIAQAIIAVRPLRSLADLAKLQNDPAITALYAKYPRSVLDAALGRLAQFGTIRQQIYTVDLMARTINSRAWEKGRTVVTAEVRMIARVYFDTFSRRAFVESIEYR
jgi:hypothetical protein